MAKERIGIMGGTFNPIHEGHIYIAQAAMETAKLDKVIFLPDGQPPHKTGIAPAEDRWRMVCAAVAGCEAFQPDRMELDRTGATYTFDTLTELIDRKPKAHYFYIIGTDTLMELQHWHRFPDVLKLCTFLVCPRTTKYTHEVIAAEKRRLTELGASIIPVDMEIKDVSSTEIRSAIAEDRSSGLISPLVMEYISLCGLYGRTPVSPQIQDWMEKLFGDLSIRRFAHSLGVAYSAKHLARNHAADQSKAEIAALLHDCAKCIPLEDLQALAQQHNLVEDKSLLSSNALLHAPVGAYLAKAKYGVRDLEILDAIAYHTTGKPGMTKLDLIIYLADKIEPSRKNYPVLNKLRMMAPLSLERSVLMSMESTEGYVSKSGKPLHPQTERTIVWLKEQIASTSH